MINQLMEKLKNIFIKPRVEHFTAISADPNDVALPRILQKLLFINYPLSSAQKNFLEDAKKILKTAITTSDEQERRRSTYIFIHHLEDFLLETLRQSEEFETLHDDIAGILFNDIYKNEDLILLARLEVKEILEKKQENALKAHRANKA